MSRMRKPIPGVDPKLLIKDAGKLMPEPSRRLFLRGAASVGALALLSGCDIVDGDTAERRAARRLALQRPGAGLHLQPDQARADLSGKRDHAAVPVQRLLPRGRSARGRRGRLRARSGRARRRQETRGRSRSSMRSRRRSRSRGMSASRAGARSEAGPAPRCASSCAASGRTRARNMSGSAAPRATPTRSTWRPRCIRRRR